MKRTPRTQLSKKALIARLGRAERRVKTLEYCLDEMSRELHWRRQKDLVKMKALHKVVAAKFEEVSHVIVDKAWQRATAGKPCVPSLREREDIVNEAFRTSGFLRSIDGGA